MIKNDSLLSRVNQPPATTSTMIEVDGYGPVEVVKLPASKFIYISSMMVDADGNPDKSKVGEAMVLAAAFGMGWTEDDVPALENHPELVAQVSKCVMSMNDSEIAEEKKD